MARLQGVEGPGLSHGKRHRYPRLVLAAGAGVQQGEGNYGIWANPGVGV